MPKRALSRPWILACLLTFTIPIVAILHLCQFMGWTNDRHPITFGDYFLAPLGVACILAFSWLAAKDRRVDGHKRGPGRRPP